MPIAVPEPVNALSARTLKGTRLIASDLESVYQPGSLYCRLIRSSKINVEADGCGG